MSDYEEVINATLWNRACQDCGKPVRMPQWIVATCERAEREC